MTRDQRFDLKHTSSGKGLKYTPGYYFPASDFKTTIDNPLPPDLAKQDEIIKQFTTTTGQTHDYKHYSGMLSNSQHLKAPGQWNVHYNKDLREKLQNRPWRKPLTMGCQETEVQSHFQGARLQPGVDFGNNLAGNPQPTSLQIHHENIPPPVKDNIPKYKPSLVRDDGVMQLLDPYVPTSHRTHKRFSRHELDGVPKKDAATYWRCEDYPQVWGHGTKHNALPKGSVPRERGQSTDKMVFKSRIVEPVRWPERLQRCPHDGIKSIQTTSYQTPSDPKMREIFYCPVDTPWVIPEAGPRQIFAVPNMYSKEYDTYASGKPVVIL